jgi:8-hydroxy-5-deazaflavin:NADPH oxidoreductase
MNITIFGAGKMGHALGMRLAPAGHHITYVSRTTEHAKQTADDVRRAAKSGAKIGTATHDEAALGEVVILAAKYTVNLELVGSLGSRLAGKVVVDISNSFNASYDWLAVGPETSAGEEIAKAADPSAKVVKAFNTIYSATLETGKVAGQPLDVFIAGNDAGAREVVAKLAKDGGMRPVDCGELKYARLIEAMEMLQIIVQKSLGTNSRSTIKLLS